MFKQKPPKSKILSANSEHVRSALHHLSMINAFVTLMVAVVFIGLGVLVVLSDSNTKNVFNTKGSSKAEFNPVDEQRQLRTPVGLGPDQVEFVQSGFANDIRIRVKPTKIEGPEGYYYAVGVSYESPPDGVGAYIGIQHNGGIRSRGLAPYYNGDISLFASWANYGAEPNTEIMNPNEYVTSSCESAGFDGGAAQGCGVYIPYTVSEGQTYELRILRSTTPDVNGIVWLTAYVSQLPSTQQVLIGRIRVPLTYGKIRFSYSFKEAFYGSSERCSYTNNSGHEVFSNSNDSVGTGTVLGSSYGDLKVKRAYECVHIGYRIPDGWGTRTFELSTEGEAIVLETCFKENKCLVDGTIKPPDAPVVPIVINTPPTTAPAIIKYPPKPDVPLQSSSPPAVITTPPVTPVSPPVASAVQNSEISSVVPNTSLNLLTSQEQGSSQQDTKNNSGDLPAEKSTVLSDSVIYVSDKPIAKVFIVYVFTSSGVSLLGFSVYSLIMHRRMVNLMMLRQKGFST